MHDIVIIGAGTAGMTAAIYALRAGKQVLLLESSVFGGQITYSPNVENYPGIMQMTGNEFASNLLEQALSLGAEVELEEAIEIRVEDDKKVVLTGQKEICCKAIILATGVTQRALGILGEEELFGEGISYCAVCDGTFYKDKEVAVVGGGNTALQDALYLTDICKRVFLIHRRKEFRAEQHLIQQLKTKCNVVFLLDSTIVELERAHTLSGIVVENRETREKKRLRIEGLFIGIGQVPNNQICSEIVPLDSQGYMIATEDCMTAVPGVFAAGDCRTKEVRQLTTATADGAVAGLAACNYCNTL
ncbi:NAD(P)/FAD-dependent oxidoreductase [Lachnospiraceae bacterium LCP25S3_G4]